MNAPENALNAFPAAHQVKCKGCPTLFTPRRSWQIFCTDACRMEAHRRKAMGPEGQIAELHEQVKALKAGNEALKRKVDDLERRVTVLDEPTAR